MAKVMLSASGAGSVVYHIFDASDMVDANEWAKLPVTFQWEAGGDMPAIGSSYVNVSFNPVSSAIGGDTFADNGAQVPRFIATSGDPIMVLKIDDCTTTLLFPFVTNVAHVRYRTGYFQHVRRGGFLHDHLQRRQCTGTTDHPSHCWRGAVDSPRVSDFI